MPSGFEIEILRSKFLVLNCGEAVLEDAQRIPGSGDAPAGRGPSGCSDHLSRGEGGQGEAPEAQRMDSVGFSRPALASKYLLCLQ